MKYTERTIRATEACGDIRRALLDARLDAQCHDAATNVHRKYTREHLNIFQATDILLGRAGCVNAEDSDDDDDDDAIVATSSVSSSKPFGIIPSTETKTQSRLERALATPNVDRLVHTRYFEAADNFDQIVDMATSLAEGDAYRLTTIDPHLSLRLATAEFRSASASSRRPKLSYAGPMDGVDKATQTAREDRAAKAAKTLLRYDLWVRLRTKNPVSADDERIVGRPAAVLRAETTMMKRKSSSSDGDMTTTHNVSSAAADTTTTVDKRRRTTSTTMNSRRLDIAGFMRTIGKKKKGVSKAIVMLRSL